MWGHVLAGPSTLQPSDREDSLGMLGEAGQIQALGFLTLKPLMLGKTL